VDGAEGFGDDDVTGDCKVFGSRFIDVSKDVAYGVVGIHESHEY
jgi:hypothetical protein